MDREQLGVKEFWARCSTSAELPETAAPSPGAFRTAFESVASAGAETAVCVTLSSKLSATNEAAAQAARGLATTSGSRSSTRSASRWDRGSWCWRRPRRPAAGGVR